MTELKPLPSDEEIFGPNKNFMFQSVHERQNTSFQEGAIKMRDEYAKPAYEALAERDKRIAELEQNLVEQTSRKEAYLNETYELDDKIEKLTAEIESMKAEILWLREIVKQYKIIGSDGCSSCDTGRVTMALHNHGRCYECDSTTRDLIESLKDKVTAFKASQDKGGK